MGGHHVLASSWPLRGDNRPIDRQKNPAKISAWNGKGSDKLNHQLMLIVENQPGVLARIALTTQRFANIDFLRAEPLGGTTLALVELQVDRSCTKIEILAKRLAGLIQIHDVVPIPPRGASVAGTSHQEHL